VFNTLCGAAESLRSWRIKKSHQTISFDELAGEEQLPTLYETPEDVAQQREFEAHLVESAGLDAFARAVAATWVRCPDMKPKDIADELNTSPQEVQNAKRRIRREYNKRFQTRRKRFPKRR
jgi:DNA-directed RNA polymerase specialized sigma24 family protein